MKKRGLLLAIMIGALSIFTGGCGFSESIVINNDGSSIITVETTMMEEEAKEYEFTQSDLEEMGFTEKTIEGKTYYVQTETEKLDASATKKEFTALTSSKMEYYFGDDVSNSMYSDSDVNQSDMSDMSCTLNITFPKKVLKSNARILSDGRTISFDLTEMISGKRIYAAMSSEAVNSKKIDVTGVTNNKIYKTAKNVKVNSPGVITSLKVNNIEQKENYFSASSSKKYTVQIKLLSGATKTVRFTVDKVKPTVNVKAKTYKKPVKIKFSDKLTGIKKATLNGKSIKNGKKISKNGQYTLKVTDKAGNTKIVKFKIKKK